MFLSKKPSTINLTLYEKKKTKKKPLIESKLKSHNVSVQPSWMMSEPIQSWKLIAKHVPNSKVISLLLLYSHDIVCLPNSSSSSSSNSSSSSGSSNSSSSSGGGGSNHNNSLE